MKNNLVSRCFGDSIKKIDMTERGREINLTEKDHHLRLLVSAAAAAVVMVTTRGVGFLYAGLANDVVGDSEMNRARVVGRTDRTCKSTLPRSHLTELLDKTFLGGFRSLITELVLSVTV